MRTLKIVIFFLFLLFLPSILTKYKNARDEKKLTAILQEISKITEEKNKLERKLSKGDTSKTTKTKLDSLNIRFSNLEAESKDLLEKQVKIYKEEHKH